MHNAVFVQVIHCRQDLAEVAPHLPLLQTLLLTDPVHQVSSGAQLHGHVVAVLRLQSLEHTHRLVAATVPSWGDVASLPPAEQRCVDVEPSGGFVVLASCSSARTNPDELSSCR